MAAVVAAQEEEVQRLMGAFLLEKVLEERKLTQQQAADLCELDHSEISRILGGSRTAVMTRTAAKLNAAFDIPFAAWLDLEPDEVYQRRLRSEQCRRYKRRRQALRLAEETAKGEGVATSGTSNDANPREGVEGEGSRT